MNVPIPELARSMRPATTVLEATLVSATQDLNLAVETGVSMAQGECVKVGEGVFCDPGPSLFAVVGQKSGWISAEFKALIYKGEANHHSFFLHSPVHSFNKYFWSTYFT